MNILPQHIRVGQEVNFLYIQYNTIRTIKGKVVGMGFTYNDSSFYEINLYSAGTYVFFAKYIVTGTITLRDMLDE